MIFKRMIFKRAFRLLSKNNAQSNVPPFTIGLENGFLPRQDPIVALPKDFQKLEDLLQRMPVRMANGKPGLLHYGTFGDAVNNELPVYNVDTISDYGLLTALFRDYTFAASAYILEPCDVTGRVKGGYALGRDRLPKCLAVPLVQVSEKIGAKPFMEYAQSYALYNYKRKDANKGLEYENLDLIRTFSGIPSESGFILVHVAMVAHSGNQVKYTLGALDAIQENNRSDFVSNLQGLLNTLKKINNTMDTMWSHSSPEDYLKFRTFIMGTKNQVSLIPLMFSQCFQMGWFMKGFRQSQSFIGAKVEQMILSFLPLIIFCN